MTQSDQQSPGEAPPDDRPFVLSEKKEGVGTLTLNRPEKRNTLSVAMLRALREGLEAFRNDAEVKAIIIAAKGPVFSSGHFISEFVNQKEADVRAVVDLCSEIIGGLQHLPKPVIARVEGLASAAGCQLVASCDLVVASSDSRFQTPGVQIGLFCSTPMVPISRVIPPKKAMDMLLTGNPMGAEDAERAGLVSRIVSPEKIEQETFNLARQIISYSSYTLALGKEAFYKQLPLNPVDAYEVGKEAITRNAMAPAGQEGMRAFLEKRPPRWDD